VDGDPKASLASAHPDPEAMMKLTPGVAHSVAHQFARDQAAVIERPASVVDLRQGIPNNHRRAFIARQFEREQIIRS
jgi:hypothetical protein